MLPATSRLRRRPEFTQTVRHGRRAGRPRLVVHLYDVPADVGTIATSPLASPRAGFVVGRTVGPAVVRNRVRRQLRHLVADRLGALPLGSTLVVRALPAAAGASSDELGADLDSALARVRGASGVAAPASAWKPS